ncbi:MAG: hypothetical protein WC460_05580 [Patescibacteria group bacterium]
MIKIEQEVKSAGKTLFGESISESLLEAFTHLSRTEKKEGFIDPFSLTRASLKGLCLQTKSWQDIAKIVVAAVAYRPGSAEKWLQVICEPFSLNLFKEDTDLLQANPAFILGTTLGLFQAINWLDQHWRTLTAFENDFYDEIAEVILWKDQFSDLTDQLLPDPTYESQLSQAIKAFVRGEPGLGWKGERLYFTLSLVQKVLSKLVNQNRRKKELSKIGTLVLDQISYAWWGTESLMGRVNGIAILGKERDFDKNIAAQAIPKLFEDKELFYASNLASDAESSWEQAAFQMLAKSFSESKPAIIWQIIKQADEKIKGKIELSMQAQILADKIAFAIFDQLDVFGRALTAILPLTTILNEICSQSGRRLLQPDL